MSSQTHNHVAHSPSAPSNNPGQQAGQFKHEPSSISKEAISFESKTIGGYILGSTLGSGSCAVVKLGTHYTTGKKVAVKIVKPTTLREQKEVIREVEALQVLQKLHHHPHIIRLLKVLREDGYSCLILDLANHGDLFDYVLQKGKIPELQARAIFRQLVSAVTYSHAHLVVHRDLKPENVLIDANGSIKISDFGLSTILKPGTLCSTFCGSPVYCPPEVVLQQQYNGYMVDVWSLGVILYVMVTGGMPWRLEKNVVKNMDDLIVANYNIPECFGITTECKSLIKMMLTASSKERACMTTIANHPWVSTGFDGPPEAFLKPQALIEKNEINENIVQQMYSLGIDPQQTQHDIQTNPTSPALTTYHILLEKQIRTSQQQNVLANNTTDINTIFDDIAKLPNPALSVNLLRQRATSIPQNNTKCAQQPPILSPPHNKKIIANSQPTLSTTTTTTNNKCTNAGILQNLTIYFEKLNKFRINKKKESAIQHNSPVHSPTLQKRRV